MSQEFNRDKSPSFNMEARIGAISILIIVPVACLVWFNFVYRPINRPANLIHANLDEVVEQTVRAMLNAEQTQLTDISTSAATKRISDSYKFDVFRGYEGTFDDYLRMAGEQVEDACPEFVTRSDLGPGLVYFWFGANPEGVTLAFRRVDGQWRLAFFSLGEIDAQVVQREAMK